MAKPIKVPGFKVQLAVDVPIHDVKLPIWGQLKYNGVRVITLVDGNSITFVTRNGNTFEFPELEASIRALLIGKTMLDGEICFGDSKGTDHTKVSGIINSALHGTPVPDGLGLVYNVFDNMALIDFNANKCHHQYTQRWKWVTTMLEDNPFDNVKAAELYLFETYQQIEETFTELLKKGYEGLILKSPEHLYTFKRNKTWIKIKAIKTDADLKCIGTFEGKGKYTGMIGGLICQGQVDGKEIEVRVGSGLNDCQRSFPDEHYLNKIIEVKYNTVIQDKSTGNWSLFLPRFVCVRGDLS